MTADMSLLVEQKSGKNQKIEYQSHDAHGLQLESHYVQLLLLLQTKLLLLVLQTLSLVYQDLLNLFDI